MNSGSLKEKEGKDKETTLPGFDEDAGGLGAKASDKSLKLPSEADEKIAELKSSTFLRIGLFVSFAIITGFETLALPFEIYWYWGSALEHHLFNNPPKGLLPMMGVTLAILAAVPLTVFLSLANLVRPSYHKQADEGKEQQGITTLAQSILGLLTDLSSKLSTLIKK